MKFSSIILTTEKGKMIKINPKYIKDIEFDFIRPVIIMKTGKRIELNKDDYQYTDWLTFIHHIQILFDL